MRGPRDVRGTQAPRPIGREGDRRAFTCPFINQELLHDNLVQY